MKRLFTFFVILTALMFNVIGVTPVQAVPLLQVNLGWNTFLGGSGTDIVSNNWDSYNGAIAVDGSGNVYVAGTSTATWGSPLVDYAHHGSRDAFVAKLDSSGSLVWHIFLGGTGNDYGNTIALDTSGNVYLGGTSASAWSCSTPCTVRAYTWNDAYVAKISPAGALVWNSFMGGGDYDEGNGIAVDSGDNIYIAGHSFAAWGCVVDCTVRDHLGNISEDGFVAKLDSSGNLTWNTFLGKDGSNAYDVANAVAVDGSNVYVGGYSTDSWETPVRAHAGSGTYDSFLTKLDSSSGALTWNTFLGGTGDDWIYSIQVDGSGNIYTAGYSEAAWSCSPAACTARAYTTSWKDGFAAKVDSSGALTWNTFLGAGGSDEAYSVALDGSGNVLVSGWSDATWESPIRAHSGGNDAFAVQLNPSDGSLVWNTFLGGGGAEYGNAITENSGKVYVAGMSNATWGSSPVRSYTSGNDVFVAIMGSSDKAITGFTFPTSTSTTIDEATHTVTVTVPEGTDRSSLTPTITHTGASVSPNSGVAQDFTSAVTYTVTAQDGSTQNYTVKVPSPEKAITAFSVNVPLYGSVTGVITGTNISVVVPGKTNLSNLKVTFTKVGAGVLVNSTAGWTQQTSGSSVNNFSSPVVYRVVADNGTTKDYTVTVTHALDSKDITEFYFNTPAASGVISGTNIAVTVPAGTNVSALTAYFKTTGSSVKVGATTQFSGKTANNFASPVTYTVTASNAATKNYTVTVSYAPSSGKEITEFALGKSKGVITGTNIAVNVPYGDDITQQAATYSTTGKTVKLPSGANQRSGVTSNSFNDPLTYTVVAADNTTQDYTVAATVTSPVVENTYPERNFIGTTKKDGAPVYVWTEGELLKSDDGGTTFNRMNVTNLGQPPINRRAIVFPTGATTHMLDVATYSGVYTSVDNGGTFTVINMDDGLPSNIVNDVARTPDSSDVYYATADGFARNSGGTISSRTTSNGLGSNDVRAVATNPKVATQVIAGTANGLSISNDNGDSFVNKTTTHGLGSNSINKVSVTPGGDIRRKEISALSVAYDYIIFVATDGGLSISTDGGNTFVNRTTSDGLPSNVILDVYTIGSYVYVATPAGMAVSVDGGKTFHSVTTADGLGDNQVNGIFADGNVIFAATSAGLSRLADVSKDITEFGFISPAATGIIDESAGIIVVTVPAGTDLTALIPTFAFTGVSVSVDDVSQENGETANDFTDSVTYTVTAANGSSKSYTVVVSPHIVARTFCAESASTNLSTVTFSAIFSEPVTGVDISDFKLTNTLLTGASITNVSGSGTDYVVTANSGTGDGTIRLDVLGTATIQGIGRSFNKLYSGGTACVIYKGNAPTVPVLKAPLNGTLVTSTPTLDWNDSSQVMALAAPIAWYYQVNITALGGYNKTFDTDGNTNALSGLSLSTLTIEPKDALPANTTFYWKVRAYNDQNQYSAWSLPRNFRTRLSTPVLNAPAENETLNNKRPTFEWDSVDGATSYTLQIFLGTSVVNSGTIKAPAYTYTPKVDLLPSKTYKWHVKANGVNAGTYSAKGTFTTSINPPKIPTLYAPASNALLPASGTQLLDWNPVAAVTTTSALTTFPAADSYEVQYANNATFTGATVATATTNSATTELNIATLPGRTYYWRVRSWSADGNHSAWSLTRAIKVKFAAPTLVAPASLATGISRMSPTFTWTSSNALWTSYTIQLATTPPTATSFSVVKSFTVLAPTQTYTAALTPTTQLLASKTYYWRVRINGIYTPIYSEVRSFTTAAP